MREASATPPAAPEPTASDGAAHSAAPSAYPNPEQGQLTPPVKVPTSSRPGGVTRGAVRRVPGRTGMTAGSAGGLMLMVVTALAGTSGVLWLATQTARGQVWDERARRSVGANARAWVHIVDPLTAITISSVAVSLTVLVVIAAMRRRFALAAAAVVLVTGANVTTQLAKRLITPHPHLYENSAPSGHTTVAMSVCLAALLVAPTAVRLWLLPFAGFVATFVGAGTLVGQWHRPADVVAGYGVCLAWAALALALAQVTQRHERPPSVKGAGRPAWSLMGASAAGLVFVVLGVRPVAHDVHLAVAAISLGGIGIVSALVLAWVAWAADDDVD